MSQVETASRLPAAGAAGQFKKQARREFEKWATSYDRSWLNEIVFFPSIRACQEELERWLAERGPTPFHILDVGCGTGTMISRIARHPLAERLVGLDYAAEMTRRAAEKFEAMNLVELGDAAGAARLHAVNADAERLPFPDGSFDVITCCNSFHHYPHQAAVIRGFRRVLRPGGLLVLVDGFRDNVIGWTIFDVFVTLIEKHVHHATWREFRTMLEEAGFEQITQRKMNVLAPLIVNVART